MWDRPNYEPPNEVEPRETPPTNRGDATRVVGAEDGSDPTLTHDVLSPEEKWSKLYIFATAHARPR